MRLNVEHRTPNVERRMAKAERPKTLRAFTMVEIAIALGIIGFALVAIIGILPAGLQVQKETRERSIMDKEAEYWINAIKRSGDYTNDFLLANAYQDDVVDFVERINGTPIADVNIRTTARVIGQLIRTNYIVTYDAGGVPSVEWTDPVTAIVRPFNGGAIERGSVYSDFAFKYQMNVHIAPSFTIRPDHPDYNALQSKLWELRLEFAWPVINGQALRTQAVHRATIAGDLTTADHPLPSDFYYFAR